MARPSTYLPVCPLSRPPVWNTLADREEYDPAWVHMLSSWLNPSNMNVLLESPSLAALPDAPSDTSGA